MWINANKGIKGKVNFDYIRFTEVDMIPFFQYAGMKNIDNYVKLPYEGVAGKIPTSDNNILGNVTIIPNNRSITDANRRIYVSRMLIDSSLRTRAGRLYELRFIDGDYRL